MGMGLNLASVTRDVDNDTKQPSQQSKPVLTMNLGAVSQGAKNTSKKDEVANTTNNKMPSLRMGGLGLNTAAAQQNTNNNADAGGKPKLGFLDVSKA